LPAEILLNVFQGFYVVIYAGLEWLPTGTADYQFHENTSSQPRFLAS
jgi:hypothetical protein